MPPPPGFINFSAQDLALEAGGDPWQSNDELQSGQPGAINDLADAFHRAAGCVAEVEDDFVAAKQRFDHGFRHNGSAPINESAEVARVTSQLQLQRPQIAMIAADLEGIAASLAMAQVNSDAVIGNLDTTLHSIDDQISAAMAAGRDAKDLHEIAVSSTRAAVGAVHGIRDGYIAVMKSAESAMLSGTGYVPDEIDAIDGQPGDAAMSEAQQYDQSRRAMDEATVRAAGVSSPAGQEAAARLRDYAVITDTHSTIEARRLAGERLADYRMSRQAGPFATDPITGKDAVTRARDRLYAQNLGEKTGLSPDRVTALMDQGEAHARSEMPRELVRKLEGAGMSPEGANKVVSNLESGKGVPQELLEINQAVSGAAGGIEAKAESLPTGKHWGDLGYSAQDVEAMSKLGKYLGTGGSVAEVLFGLYELQQGEPFDEVAVKTGASIGGGIWAGAKLGAIGGEMIGPEGAFIGGALGAILGGTVSSDVASNFYSWLKE